MIIEEKALHLLTLLRRRLDLSGAEGLGRYPLLCEVGVEMIRVKGRQDRGGRGQNGKCVSPAHLDGNAKQKKTRKKIRGFTQKLTDQMRMN